MLSLISYIVLFGNIFTLFKRNILYSCSDYIYFIGGLVTLITDIHFIRDVTGYVIATYHITPVIVIVTQIAVIILRIAVNIKLRLTHKKNGQILHTYQNCKRITQPQKQTFAFLLATAVNSGIICIRIRLKGLYLSH